MSGLGLQGPPRPAAVVAGDGHVLVDGGVLAHVPVRAALKAGAARAAVLSTGSEERPLTHGPTVVVPTGIETWPAPWALGHAQRTTGTAALAAGRFPDRPGLHRGDRHPAAPSVAPGTARTVPEARTGR